jgi:DNA-binding GntR family transcriptional regulator
MNAKTHSSEALSILQSNSLSMVLEREIERFIMSGEFNPGDRINENQLATRFGTSRGPIREALRSLEGKGFVELIPNRGVFIRQIGTHEALEVYDVRAALFGMAGRLLAEHVTEVQLAELRSFLSKMDVASAERDFDTYYPLNLAFHEFIVDAAGNAILAAQYRIYVKKLHLYRARSLVAGGGLSVSNQEHHAMVEAIASRDPTRAQEAHFQHVYRAKIRLLAVVKADGANHER